MPLDELHEECGVFGIYAPGEDVARFSFFGLFALQHRGQESAGIAAADGHDIRIHTRMGLVNTAFSEDDLSRLSGHVAIGHTRYSTTGSSKEINAGPFLVRSENGPVAVAHNGNLVNSENLRRDLVDRGIDLVSSTDSEALTWTIALTPGDDIAARVRQAMKKFVGAYSLTVLTNDAVVAVRDPLGIRPLCLGRLEHGGWVFASESCALATIGATFEREIEPGEIVVVDANGLRSYPAEESDGRQATCIFESIYFARPDSQMMGDRLHLIRQRMGAELAREHPVDADIVVPMPDSAVPGAIGYAKESGIPYAEGLIKNRYIGRTFIQPNQRLREQGVKLKFNALPEALEGKRVVLVDDTIVRGTTSRPIVDMLKQSGAKEVHLRVHAPPIMWPCYMGVDMARRDELIAAYKSVQEIGEEFGATSIGYLSLEGLVRAIGQPRNRFCTACLTGQYPIPIQIPLDKLTFESNGNESGTDRAEQDSEQSRSGERHAHLRLIPVS